MEFAIMRKLLTAFLVSTLAATSAGTAGAVDVTGAGATFPYPIYAKWAEAYRQKTGIGMNYQSIGSGGGIAQIKASRSARSTCASAGCSSRSRPSAPKA